METRSGPGCGKPRALAGIRPLTLTLTVTVSAALWGLALTLGHVLTWREMWDGLDAARYYLLIVGLSLLSLALCWPEP